MLLGKPLYLCLKHYKLASTTVTGIPMKEEQKLLGKPLYLCLKHYNLAFTTVTGILMKEEQNASR
jgi:hypothetical protein